MKKLKVNFFYHASETTGSHPLRNLSQFILTLLKKKDKKIELKEDVDSRSISIINILYQVVFCFLCDHRVVMFMYPEFVTGFYTFYTLFLSFQNYYMEKLCFPMLTLL